MDYSLTSSASSNCSAPCEPAPLTPTTNRAHAVLASPFVAIPFAAMVIAGVLHMRIGMQVIIEDYTPSDAWKILFVLLNNFFSALVALAMLWAVAKLSFGM